MVDVAKGIVILQEFMQETFSPVQWLGSEILVAEAEEIEHITHQDSLLLSTVEEPFKTRVAMFVKKCGAPHFSTNGENSLMCNGGAGTVPSFVLVVWDSTLTRAG